MNSNWKMQSNWPIIAALLILVAVAGVAVRHGDKPKPAEAKGDSTISMDAAGSIHIIPCTSSSGGNVTLSGGMPHEMKRTHAVYNKFTGRWAVIIMSFESTTFWYGLTSGKDGKVAGHKTTLADLGHELTFKDSLSAMKDYQKFCYFDSIRIVTKDSIFKHLHTYQ